MADDVYGQVYGEAFARFYDQKLSFFAVRVAPTLISFFSGLKAFQSRPKTILDVACGTGQLAAAFLDEGYEVAGIDLSPHMVELAKANNKESVETGRAMFTVADASSFTIQKPVSFAVSTFDALNHLPTTDSLKGCFESVYDALDTPGLFVFDLNTAHGLSRWNGISVVDTEDFTTINRGIHASGADRAYTSFTGFARRKDGTYEKFQEVAYNTVFNMADVLRMAQEVGFQRVYAAETRDLETGIEDPEVLDRAFFVCSKGRQEAETV